MTDEAMAAAAERFAMRVESCTPGECWPWKARRSPAGYGLFYLHGGTYIMAHRFAYVLVHGDIPTGLVVDHLCRNTRCVNPDHLEAVTQRENVLRGIGLPAQNARKTHCPRGHAYDETNTYLAPSGSRICRACGRDHSRRARARNKAA